MLPAICGGKEISVMNKQKNLRAPNAAVPELQRQQGERLKKLRLHRGFKTASDAARKFEIAGPTYLAHENGTRAIRTHIAEYYAKELGSSASWILHGEGAATVDGSEFGPRSFTVVSGDDLVAEVASVLSKLEGAASKLTPAAKAMILSGLDRAKGLLSS